MQIPGRPWKVPGRPCEVPGRPLKLGGLPCSLQPDAACGRGGGTGTERSTRRNGRLVIAVHCIGFSFGVKSIYLYFTAKICIYFEK
jgi:hypothetical protein